jgi:hypothetical protein
MAATLVQLRARAALRANMDDDAANSRVLTSDWNSLINESYSELWALMESSAGDRALTSFNFTLANGSITGGMTQTLPADCDQVRGVTWNPDTDQAYDLDRFEWGERTNWPADRGLSYCPIGGVLHIYPATRAGGNYRLDYVPAQVALVNDADTVSAVVDKWNEYIVLATAIKARDVEESDTTVLERQRERMEKRIRGEARRVDAGRPRKVVDVTWRRWPARLPPP